MRRRAFKQERLSREKIRQEMHYRYQKTQQREKNLENFYQLRKWGFPNTVPVEITKQIGGRRLLGALAAADRVEKVSEDPARWSATVIKPGYLLSVVGVETTYYPFGAEDRVVNGALTTDGSVYFGASDAELDLYGTEKGHLAVTLEPREKFAGIPLAEASSTFLPYSLEALVSEQARQIRIAQAVQV